MRRIRRQGAAETLHDSQNPFTISALEATLGCPPSAGPSISVDRRHTARGLNLFPRMGSPMVRDR